MLTGSLRFLRFVLPLALAAALSSQALAGAQRTFVASTGNDADSCSLAFPCRSFDSAIAQTLPGGEVIVIDSAGYGPATISQPVSIVAPPGIYAGVSVTGGTGLTIAIASGKVAVRGLTISNTLGGTTGIAFTSGGALDVEDVTVSNFPAAGLDADVSANAIVSVRHSTFSDNGTGARFAAAAGTVTVAVDESLFARNNTGIAFEAAAGGYVHASTVSGGSTGLSVKPSGATAAAIEVRDCTIYGTSTVAVDAAQTGAAQPVTLVSLVRTLIAGNAIGIRATGTNSGAYVSDSVVTRFSTYGIDATAGGEIVSSGDNRIVANTADTGFDSTAPKL